MWLFGKQLTPEEMAKKWRQELRAEERRLDRQIRDLDLAEKKVQREMKDLAKKGRMDSARILARELVHSRKAKERFHTAKAQMNSVSMQIQQNLATVRVAGHMQKSAAVMRFMNQLVKVDDISATMQAMSKEMMKAGFIEEMIDDAMDDPTLEEDADVEVEKVMGEILGEASSTAGLANPVAARAKQPARQAAVEEEEDDMAEMHARLAALKS
eukprot:TRINITY_DN852_c0_g1_i1.p1 TRINITY_DN852_c0_g1~~TRINITY_DN852_c0_g1_i1.p1  ORF type:complete len:213 (+),score=68.90 TRINITY_DN852_c0_g1_i1:66-704(+)